MSSAPPQGPFPGYQFSMSLSPLAQFMQVEAAMRNWGRSPEFSTPDMFSAAGMTPIVTPGMISAIFNTEKNPFADSFRTTQPSIMPSPLSLSHAPVPECQQERQSHSGSESPDTKRDRRKEKNRLAAQACRQRKIDREKELRIRANELKGVLERMKTTLSQDERKLSLLRQELQQHCSAGCRFTAPA